MATEFEIEQLRKLHKPTVVRLHHVPAWFKRKMLHWMRLHDCPQPMYTNHPHTFANLVGWHIDHYGSSLQGDVFVNEPYGDWSEQNAKIAEMLHLDYVAVDNSYWSPGSTSRYEFRRRTSAAYEKVSELIRR